MSYQAYASGAAPPGPGKIPSSSASTSSVSETSSAPSASSSWAMVRGPTMGAVTTGLCSNQASDVGRRRTDGRAEFLVGLELGSMSLDLRGHPLAPAPTSTLAVLQHPSEQAASQRAVGNDPDAIVGTRRQDL